MQGKLRCDNIVSVYFENLKRYYFEGINKTRVSCIPYIYTKFWVDRRNKFTENCITL